MKYGMRKPSWKKSLSARTTGRAKRAVKRALIPNYGKRGMGWLHPKRALYNRVYRRTTFSIFDFGKTMSGRDASNSGCCVTLMFLVALVCTIACIAKQVISIIIVMDKKELRKFAEIQSEILQNSYMDADFSYIPDSELTKKYLYNHIQEKVGCFVRTLPDNIMNSNFDYLNVIYDVKYRGKQFTYLYIRDLPFFKDSEFDHVESAGTTSFLIVLKNGDVYTVNTQYGDFHYAKWKDCPQRYYPKDLLERILCIVQPLLNYDFDDEDREFGISLIKSCFPFNNHEKAHIMLQKDEMRTMEYWEYRIKNFPNLYIDRRTVFDIKKYILRAFGNEDNTPEWDRLFEQVEKDISKL